MDIFSWVPGLIPTIIVAVVAAVMWVLLSILYRTVVATNMVHIVQSRKKTTSYGTGQQGSNVYYRWPRWIPFFGVTVIKLPVSNFDLSLKDYEAYDKERVPFMVDIVAFFRIKNTGIAAQRVESTEELENQLLQIVQGAVRKVLASDAIDTIMLERAKFGNLFTDEVRVQLEEWGVEPVKSMELMDIRDGHGGKVISNIMAKKMSHIEMESRTEVAKNMQIAKTAEIAAKQTVDVRQQEAEQTVGQRTAEKDKQIGIAQQQASQEVLSQEKETKTRDMAVKQVEQVRQAEITREKEVVSADQDKQVRIIIAEGHLQAQQKEAAAIEVVGKAKGEAEKAILMAPVSAQISLAEKIAALAGYQQYLIAIEAIKAYLAVGSKQAEALKAAEIKVIANTGKPTDGVSNVMDLFSTKGGTELAGMVEAFAQTPVGKMILSKVGVGDDSVKPVSKDGKTAVAPEAVQTV
ncbi:MAG: SPFH domain-containing protein [bacterium]|nr:SPFH domain-containing protein [bacterium]